MHFPMPNDLLYLAFLMNLLNILKYFGYFWKFLYVFFVVDFSSIFGKILNFLDYSHNFYAIFTYENDSHWILRALNLYIMPGLCFCLPLGMVIRWRWCTLTEESESKCLLSNFRFVFLECKNPLRTFIFTTLEYMIKLFIPHYLTISHRFFPKYWA